MSLYDDEEYLPWYRRQTATWLELSSAARGVLVSVAMELNPKTGAMPLRKGLASLAVVLRRPWEEVEPAIAELIAAGKLVWDGSNFVLSDPEFHERLRPGRRSSSAVRMARKRERDKGNGRKASHVTRVTSRVSRDACDGSDEIREESRSEEILPPVPSGPPPRVTGPDGDSGFLFGAYVAGVREATGKPMTALSPHERRTLVALVNAHAVGFAGEALAMWVQTTARDFAKQHDPTFGGFSPAQCAKWLDGGRKARAGPAVRHVQPADNRAWELPPELK